MAATAIVAKITVKAAVRTTVMTMAKTAVKRDDDCDGYNNNYNKETMFLSQTVPSIL